LRPPLAFATYDEPKSERNVLSAATVSQTVVAGADNFVSATFDGVIASLAAAQRRRHICVHQL
jgi:hypothetical protein